MKATEKLIELENKVQELLNELRDTKMYVYALEEENQQLRTKLFRHQHEYQGYDNLVKLYEEGFHVCPANFGYSREKQQDCIFCLSFLRRGEESS